MTIPAIVRDTFSAREAAKIASLSYTTLDYWARTKLVVPSVAEANGTGTDRRYSFKDLVALRLARDLRAAGISTRALRNAIGKIQSLSNPFHEERILAIGKTVIWVRGCDDIIDVLKKPGQGIFQFMIDFPRAVTETEEHARAVRAA